MAIEHVDDAAYLGADWVMGGRPDSLFLSGIPVRMPVCVLHAAMRNACGRLTSTDLADFAGSVIYVEPNFSRANPAFRVPCPSVTFPARSPAVRMAGQARSHGSGSYRVDAHDHVAAGGTAPL